MRWWQAIRPRDRRALAIGSGVIASALCISFVVRPLWRARSELRDRLREQRTLLAREEGMIAAARRLPADLESATEALAVVRDRLFPGRDELGATAALANLVGEAARQQGVQIESFESGAPDTAGGRLVAVHIDVRGRGDLEGLLRWLKALESSRRLLRVEQLGIARERGDARSDSGDVEILSLTATVRGFVLAGAEGGRAIADVASGDLRQ